MDKDYQEDNNYKVYDEDERRNYHTVNPVDSYSGNKEEQEIREFREKMKQKVKKF